MSTEWNSVPKRLYDALVDWRYSKPNVVRACGELRELVNEMIAASPQPAAQPDCGEAGHAEGRCGNSQCLRPLAQPEPVTPAIDRALNKALENSVRFVGEPEQPEPGVLTDERVEELWRSHQKNAWGRTLISPTVFARAIEREVLSIRKLSDEQVARIMEAVDSYADGPHLDGYFGARRAEFERLLRGEA